MKTAVDQFFAEDVAALTAGLADLEERIEPLELPENDAVLGELEVLMGRALEACRRLDAEIGDDADLLKATQQRFREATAPWCGQSWIIHRARSKPRGFPGDYQMLSAIYDGIPVSRGLGGYLDRACLKMTLGRAVDARMRDARRFLQNELASREGDVAILDIACGPCREYRGGLQLDRPQQSVHVTCVDSDESALNYVSRNIAKTTPRNIRFDCVRHNALRMRSPGAIVKTFGRSDIIYSVGLADYIPDKLLIPMLSGWRGALNPGGVVYVAFKDSRRYDKVEYQWLMDWHFLQRTEEDCRRLMELAGYDMEQVETSRDETGVIIHYVSRTNVPAYVRFDREEEPQVPLAIQRTQKTTSVPS